MFSNLKNSLVGRIMLGYGAIIFLAFTTTIVSMYTTWRNQDLDKLVSDACYPMILSLKETEMLASESYKLTNNWIYQPNIKEKEKLGQIHLTEVGAQKERLLAIASKLRDQEGVSEIHHIVTSLDALVAEQEVVTTKLNSGDSYADDIAVDAAITAMDKKITPAFNSLSEQITAAAAHQSEILSNVKTSKDASSTLLMWIYIGSIALFVGIGVYAQYFSRNSITRPIAGLSDL